MPNLYETTLSVATPSVKVSKYNISVKWAKTVPPRGAKVSYYLSIDGGPEIAVRGTSSSMKSLLIGDHEIRLRAVDNFGNSSGWSDAAFFSILDVTAPKMGKIESLVSGYSAVLSWTAGDNAGVDHYIVSCGDRTITVDATEGLISGGATIDNLGLGRHTITVQAVDAAGNVSSKKNTRVNVLDVTPPDVVRGLYSVGGSNKSGAKLQWLRTDDNSGKVSRYEILIDGVFTKISSGTSLKVTKLAAGTHTFQVRALDKVGNTGEWSTVQSFEVADLIAPKIGRLKAAVQPGSVTVNWEATDEVGVAKAFLVCNGVEYETAGSSLTLTGLAAGKYSLSLYVYDAAGNRSSVKKTTFRISEKDAMAPLLAGMASFALDNALHGLGTASLTGGDDPERRIPAGMLA